MNPTLCSCCTACTTIICDNTVVILRTSLRTTTRMVETDITFPFSHIRSDPLHPSNVTISPHPNLSLQGLHRCRSTAPRPTVALTDLAVQVPGLPIFLRTPTQGQFPTFAPLSPSTSGDASRYTDRNLTCCAISIRSIPRSLSVIPTTPTFFSNSRHAHYT